MRGSAAGIHANRPQPGQEAVFGVACGLLPSCDGSEPRGRMHGLRDVCPRKGALIIGLKQAVCPSRALPVH
jgi:hypothetical protein